MGRPHLRQAHQVVGGDAAFAGQRLDAAQLDDVFVFEPFPPDPRFRRRTPVIGGWGTPSSCSSLRTVAVAQPAMPAISVTGTFWYS